MHLLSPQKTIKINNFWSLYLCRLYQLMEFFFFPAVSQFLIPPYHQDEAESLKTCNKTYQRLFELRRDDPPSFFFSVHWILLIWFYVVFWSMLVFYPFNPFTFYHAAKKVTPLYILILYVCVVLSLFLWIPSRRNHPQAFIWIFTFALRYWIQAQMGWVLPEFFHLASG